MYFFGKGSGGKMRLGGLLQQISGSGKSERLIMRGPGGRGALDVAVSSVPGKLTFNPSYNFMSTPLETELKHLSVAGKVRFCAASVARPLCSVVIFTSPQSQCPRRRPSGIELLHLITVFQS